MKILLVTSQKTEASSIGNPVIVNLYNTFKEQNIEVDILKLESSNKILRLIELFFSLLKIRLFKNSYNVVNVHFGGISALISSLFFQKKLVVTYHGTDLHGGSPHSILQIFKSKANILASRIAAHNARYITIVSKNLLEFLSIKSRKKTRIISTGVDYRKFYPLDRQSCKIKLGLDKNKKYIAFNDVSISKVKRLDLARAVESKLKHANYELLILSNLDSNVIIDYLNASEILLIVSDKEGSPNIVKECIACNVPVASFDVGDVYEFIDACGDGLKLNNKDPIFIADQIQNYLQNRKEIPFREKMKDRISLPAIADKYLDLFKMI